MEEYKAVKPTLDVILEDKHSEAIDGIIICVEDASEYIAEGTYPAEEYYKLKIDADRRRAAGEMPDCPEYEED